MRPGWLVALVASMALVAGGVVGLVSARRELRTEHDERLADVAEIGVATVDGELARVTDVLRAVPADVSPRAVAAILGDGVNVCASGRRQECAWGRPLADPDLVATAVRGSAASGGRAIAGPGDDLTSGIVVVALSAPDRTIVAHVPAASLLRLHTRPVSATGDGPASGGTQIVSGLPAGEVGELGEPHTRAGQWTIALPLATTFADGERFVVATSDDAVALSAGQRTLYLLLIAGGSVGVVWSLVVLVIHLRRLSRRATTDALTGLATRDELRRRAREVLTAAAQEGGEVAVVFLDLDGFKRINDGSGHHTGDEVLAAVARCLSSVVRSGDVVARWGGDEFAVLLPGATVEAAAARARTIGEALISLDVRGIAGVSATAGVAGAPVHGADIDDLVRAADQAMYAAKRRGDAVAIAKVGPAPQRFSSQTGLTGDALRA